MIHISQFIIGFAEHEKVSVGVAKRLLAAAWNMTLSSIYKWEDDPDVFVLSDNKVIRIISKA